MKLFLLLLGISLGINLSLAQNNEMIERVEPPFWWTGMKNPHLQLLMYGENISQANVSLDYPGVKISKASKLENPNYLFVDLIISPEARAARLPFKIKMGKKSFTYNYELKKREANSANRKGFDNSDVIYLLMPDRFANGDPSNDDQPGMLEKANRSNPDGKHGGDIQGVINHLDYFKDLGVTTLWLNPVYENNNPAYSYHGYAISDFYKVDPRYGTMDLFKDFVNQAHQKGIKVVKDMIFNHCSNQHWFYKDLPSSDWVHTHENYTTSNHIKNVSYDPYGSEHDYFTFDQGWFDKHMPDLNQKNEFLANYLIQNSIWWVEHTGLDGIRMDTYPYPDKNMMSRWSQRMMDEYPDFNIVGEVWVSNSPALLSYWQDGKINPDGYDSHTPALFDFVMHDEMKKAFHEKTNWGQGLVRLYNVLSQDFLYPDPYNLVLFIDNHDTDRAITIMQDDPRKLKMALAFMATTRGIPSLYYGTEIQMPGLEHDGHGFIRKDFPGGWESDERSAFNEAGRTPEENAMFDYIRKLLNWRAKKEVIHEGKLKHFFPKDEIYVYFRYDEQESVMVIMNNHESEAKSIDSSRYQEGLRGFSRAQEVMTGKEISDLQSITVPPKSVYILELKK